MLIAMLFALLAAGPAQAAESCELEEWTVIAFYSDIGGGVLSHQETVCGEEASEARTDEIEARGFEPTEGVRISHAAVLRVEYYPFR